MASRVTMLAAEIVAAYVTGQTVSAKAVPGLIRRVHQSLRNLPTAPPPSRPAPAQVRQLVARKPKGMFPDHLICLACGTSVKILKRHLAQVHGLTPEQYRASFNLEADYPMAAPDYARMRSRLAKKNRLGHRR